MPSEIIVADIAGQLQRFSSPQEIEKWIEEQRQAWNWFITGATPNLGAPLTQYRQKYIDAFNSLHTRTAAWKADRQNDKIAQNLTNAFSPFANPDNGLRLGSDANAAIARDVAKELGPLAGAAALATLLNIDITVQQGDAVEGITRAMLIRSGINPSSPRLVSDAVSGANSASAAQLAKQDAEWTRRTAAVDKFLKDSREFFEKQSASQRDAVYELVNSIKTTEAAYKEQMKLRASVKYWDERKEEQQASSVRYLLTMCAFVVLTFIGCWLAAREYLPLLLAFDIGKKPEAYAVSLTLTLLASTVLFWIARIIVRLYLSAHHLAIDARERVAMVQTYLALVNEDKLSPEDRSIVFIPLFRASADGIVKDESAPDLSAPALLARLLDKKS